MEMTVNKHVTYDYALNLTEEEFNTMLACIGSCSFKTVQNFAERYGWNVLSIDGHTNLYSSMKNIARAKENQRN